MSTCIFPSSGANHVERRVQLFSANLVSSRWSGAFCEHEAKPWCLFLWNYLPLILLSALFVLYFRVQSAKPTSRFLRSINVPTMPIYSPLRTDKQEIRLLTLASGRFEEDIRLKLSIANLDDKPSFTALSYCWGHPKNLTSVTLDEQEFRVTWNLESALRNWRSAQEDLLIWVDAICINQSDEPEKASQVGIMGKIYAGATNVRVWLGEESSDSNIAMEFLERVQTVDFANPDTVIDLSTMIAVKRLLRRDWWTRLWVVQEALLARKLTFHCGKRQVHVESFIRFQEESARLKWDAPPHLQVLRKTNLGGPLSVLLWSWDDYKEQIEKGGISLSQIITVTAASHYSEPLDRIFALLGVCSELERKVIQINYSMTMRDLNILVTTFFLISRRSNNPLYYLQFHQSGKDPSLPSWASDFTTPDEENHIIAPAFKAGADNFAWAVIGLPAPPPAIGSYNSLVVVFEDEMLVVPGLILEKVMGAFPSPWVNLYDGPDLDEEQERKLRRRDEISNAANSWWTYVETLPLNPDPYAEKDGRYEAFWRTLITNHGISIPKGPVTPEMDYAGRFDAWTGRKLAKMDDEEYFKPYSDAAVTRCMWRSFLITEQGYFGLGPRKTQASDLICILRGAHAPYVLRSHNNGCYELVGEAYVHGVMDGSFVRAAKEEDLMTFRIR